MSRHTKLEQILNVIPELYSGLEPVTLDEIADAIDSNYHGVYPYIQSLKKANKIYLSPTRKGRKDAFYKVEEMGLPKLDRLSTNPLDTNKQTFWHAAGISYDFLNNLEGTYVDTLRRPFRALKTFEWEDGFKEFQKEHETYRTNLVGMRILLEHMLKNVKIMIESDPFVDRSNFKRRLLADPNVDMRYISTIMRSTDPEEKKKTYAKYQEELEKRNNDE